MKYPIDTIIKINNCDWRVAEYRLGRGREWVYTLSNELVDGSFETMRLNEIAIGKIISNNSKNEVSIEISEGDFNLRNETRSSGTAFTLSIKNKG